MINFDSVQSNVLGKISARNMSCKRYRMKKDPLASGLHRVCYSFVKKKKSLKKSLVSGSMDSVNQLLCFLVISIAGQTILTFKFSILFSAETNSIIRLVRIVIELK